MFEESFIQNIFSKNKRAVARAISIVESDDFYAEQLLKEIYFKTGKAYRIGITGPPGAGKSTIVNQLTKFYRSQNKTVGIIAVDPTSPFTGGALLGDRVRMNDLGLDEGAFIRSMASRGSYGGLSKKANDAADILDAAGFDFIIMETLGVGQSELEIANAADTTVVVLVPESGDSVQAMKAGLMEIADFFVINKSDRPGSQNSVNALKSILMIKEHDVSGWLPNIINSIASENKGIDEIASEIERHKKFLLSNNKFLLKRESRTKARIKEIVENKIRKKLWYDVGLDNLSSSLEKVVLGNLSPYHIAEEIIDKFKNLF